LRSFLLFRYEVPAPPDRDADFARSSDSLSIYVFNAWFSVYDGGSSFMKVLLPLSRKIADFFFFRLRSARSDSPFFLIDGRRRCINFYGPFFAKVFRAIDLTVDTPPDSVGNDFLFSRSFLFPRSSYGLDVIRVLSEMILFYAKRSSSKTRGCLRLLHTPPVLRRFFFWPQLSVNFSSALVLLCGGLVFSSF